MKILVTGGSGFIGSHFVRTALSSGHSVLNIDVETYAASDPNLLKQWFVGDYHHAKIDICDLSACQSVFEGFNPDLVVHFAAESHVDRSINAPLEFVKTNVLGTTNLLTISLNYWERLKDKSQFKFLAVSTDEVYGSLGSDGKFTEISAYSPNSPYSASKAGADHLVRSFFQTYGLPVIITNCSNNYGPNQHAEKLIPTIIRNIALGEEIPIYGDGSNVRDWIYVSDHVEALNSVMKSGRVGEQYLIGANCEVTNLQMAKKIINIMNTLQPKLKSFVQNIKFIEDRPGHDFR